MSYLKTTLATATPAAPTPSRVSAAIRVRTAGLEVTEAVYDVDDIAQSNRLPLIAACAENYSVLSLTALKTVSST
jgi:hypothetical protein